VRVGSRQPILVGSLIGGPHRTAHRAPPIPHAWRQVVKVDWRGVLVRLAGRTGRESVSTGRCLCGLVQGHVASLWIRYRKPSLRHPIKANHVPAGSDFTLLRYVSSEGFTRAYRHRKGHDTWHLCSDSHTAAHGECVHLETNVVERMRRISQVGIATSASLLSSSVPHHGPELSRSWRELCRRPKARVPQRHHSGRARAATFPGRRW
jgi:hypothetical protein